MIRLFDEDSDRIMHLQLEMAVIIHGLNSFWNRNQRWNGRRNKNGIIDSIDDTISLIDELVNKGYDAKKIFATLELNDGKHDVGTWAKAFPDFLKWGWESNCSFTKSISLVVS